MLAKTIEVVVHVNFTSDVRDYFIYVQVVIWIKKLSWYCIGTWTWNWLLLFILYLSMRVIEVYRNYLFRDRRLERTCNLACYSIG